MSSVIEDYAKEYAKDYANKVANERETKAATIMLKEGVPTEIILKALPSLSLDFIRQLQQQLKQV